MNISFTIPGPPVPKARARVSNGHAYTPARTKAYEAKVKALALVARQQAKQRCWTGPVKVWMLFCLLGKVDSRPDIDNLAKSLLDGCKGVIFQDDAQIVTLKAYKSGNNGEAKTIVEFETEE